MHSAQARCAFVPHLPLALAAAVDGDTFGRTRSLAISQRGHGHHLLQQNLKEVRQLRARAQDLAGEASCVRSLCVP